MKNWNQFWFEFNHPWALAIGRIQIGLVMLWLYGVRHLENLDAFSNSGMVPRSLAIQLMLEPYRPPFAWFDFWPDSAAVIIHGIFLIFLLLFTLGAGSRIWGPLAWVLHMGFLQRNYAILFGADVLVGLSLFYLMMTRCDEVLSLRSLWRYRRGDERVLKGDMVSSAFSRLWMIQIVILYAYTGWEKLKGLSWWDGTALWTVMGNPQMVVINMDFLRHFPMLVVLMSFLTLIFEIYFPAAVLNEIWRKPWLVFGFFFHIGIALLMNLWTFSFAMLAAYWLFLKPQELQAIGHFVLKRISAQNDS